MWVSSSCPYTRTADVMDSHPGLGTQAAASLLGSPRPGRGLAAASTSVRMCTCSGLWGKRDGDRTAMSRGTEHLVKQS